MPSVANRTLELLERGRLRNRAAGGRQEEVGMKILGHCFARKFRVALGREKFTRNEAYDVFLRGRVFAPAVRLRDAPAAPGSSCRYGRG